MGTVQNIVETLKRLNEQKKGNLTSRYQEHSAWLARELSLIKDLIKQNPRDKIGNDVTEDENVSVIANAQNKDDNSIRQKRKSPETSIQMNQDESSQSPEQKRSSGDYTKVENGVLPNDLNKLKKEQLLHELEIRGNKMFTMKALKKDLVDALKELLAQDVSTSNQLQSIIAQPQINTSNIVPECITFSDVITPTNNTSNDSLSASAILPTDNNVNTIVNEISASNITQIQPQSASKAPQRKGSLMAGIRTLVQSINPVVKVEEESEESKNARLQNEFQARQRRHRDSQARKSQSEFDDLPKEPIISQDSIPSEVQISSFTDVKSPVNSTWMEVASPIPEVIITNIETMGLPDKDVSNLEQTFSAISVETQLELPEVDPIGDSQSPGSASNEKEVTEIASDSNIYQEDHAKQVNSSVEEVSNIIKKPTNLLTGQSSFIDNKGVKKIAIPALESAKLAKAAEEAKQLNRKKELEKKKAAYLSSAQGSSSSSTIVSGISSSSSSNIGAVSKPVDKPLSAPIVSTSTYKTVSTNKPTGGVPALNNKPNVSVPSTAPITSNAISSTVPAKKGIFGFLKNTTKPIISSIVGTSNNSTGVTTPISKSETKTDSPRDDAFDISACVLKDVPAIPQSTAVSRISSSKNSSEKILPQEIFQEASQETLPTPPPLPLQNLAQAPKSPAMIESMAELSQQDIQPVTTNVEIPTAPVIVETAPIKHVPIVTPATTLRPNEIVETKGYISPVPAATDHPQILKDITQEQVAEEDEEPISTDQYQIDDRESSDSSGSGTDDEAEQEKQKRIPEWARGPQLKEALERQYGGNGHAPIDPDLIFPEVQTCSLEEIFGTKEGKAGQYSKRTSSAKWDHDELTLVEKRTYRMQMGYGNAITKPSSVKMN